MLLCGINTQPCGSNIKPGKLNRAALSIIRQSLLFTHRFYGELIAAADSPVKTQTSFGLEVFLGPEPENQIRKLELNYSVPE